MATGALDANGIWIYGEDDSETTFSGLLNKLGDSVSDKFTGGLPIASGGTGATSLTGAHNSLDIGLIQIMPSGVLPGGGGSSASIIDNGTVSFNNCSALTIQAFGAYDNYVLEFHGGMRSGGPSAYRWNFARPNNTLETSALYYYRSLYINNVGGVTGFSGDTQTSGMTGWGFASGGDYDTFRLTLYGVGKVRHKAYTFQGAGYVSSEGGGYVTTTEAFSGFAVYPISGGTFGGELKIYGFND